MAETVVNMDTGDITPRPRQVILHLHRDDGEDFQLELTPGKAREIAWRLEEAARAADEAARTQASTDAQAALGAIDDVLGIA